MQPLRKPCGASIALEHLHKGFEDRVVLRDIELAIPPGQFVAVVGRSGCGKSTLLRLLCGLEHPSGGAARVLDESGANAQGSVRVVFQEPRLLPWKSVLDNVCIGARHEREAARAALDAVGLLDRAEEYPTALSGGQRQRVALARALVHEPCVLLLDEPFGALDALTRIEAQRLVESLWLERGFTVLLVTHDVSEAVLLADRVLLIEDGRIAADQRVTLPRPRRRENPELATIAGHVLDRILATPASPPRTLAASPEPVSALQGHVKERPA
ncbi:MAG: ATP-binding cassette domain-containing protein [Polyangiaceae bacterium]